MIRGTRRATVLACVAAVCCCCWTLPSAAQVATLSWSAPRGCPDQTNVAARLTALQTETARRDLRVRARVQRVGAARYVLKLVLRATDYHAERRLESTSCTSVVDAAIWLIAVALDPSQSTGSVASPSSDASASQLRSAPQAPPGPTGEPGLPSATSVKTPPASASAATEALRSPGEASADGSAPQPPSTTQVAPTTAVAVPTAAAPAPTAAAPASTVDASENAGRAPWRVDWARLPRWWRAGLFGGVWSAALPAPQASIGARLGFGISAFYAELRGAAELPRAQPVPDLRSRAEDPGASTTAEVRFATQDLGLALCSQWGDRTRVGPCITASALRTSGSMQGAPEANHQVLPWGAAGVSLELGFRPVGRLELMLDTGVQLPISARPRYTVEGVGEVAVAAPVSVYARLGLGFRSTDVAREQ